MAERTPEERERARLEREARRTGKPIPPAPKVEPEPAPPPPPNIEPAPPEPPAWDGRTEDFSFDPQTALVDDYTEHLASHIESPPPPPQKVSHGQMLGRAALAFGAVVALVLLWFLVSLFQPFGGGGEGEGKVPLRIAAGADVSQIADQLSEAGVVGSARNFRWRASLSGKSDQFKSGRYIFGEGMSYGAAIDLLASGPNAGTISVTIVEGRSRYEISKQVSAAGLKGDYMEASKSSQILDPQRYGAPKDATLEGFLFPATYEMPAAGSVNRLISQQLRAFKQNIAGVSMRHARSKNLTVFDVVTIASLIDREVSVPRERRIVASVIYNRLKQGIPLGIDATTRFETRNWTEPLTNSVLQKDTPYNTRTRQGLPPGPIGNPGLAAIEAAANPARTSYLFYVANPCKPGTHTFTRTNAEFEAAVAKYNRAREAAGGKQPTGC